MDLCKCKEWRTLRNVEIDSILDIVRFVKSRWLNRFGRMLTEWLTKQILLGEQEREKGHERDGCIISYYFERVKLAESWWEEKRLEVKS